MFKWRGNTENWLHEVLIFHPWFAFVRSCLAFKRWMSCLLYINTQFDFTFLLAKHLGPSYMGFTRHFSFTKHLLVKHTRTQKKKKKARWLQHYPATCRQFILIKLFFFSSKAFFKWLIWMIHMWAANQVPGTKKWNDDNINIVRLINMDDWWRHKHCYCSLLSEMCVCTLGGGGSLASVHTHRSLLPEKKWS